MRLAVDVTLDGRDHFGRISDFIQDDRRGVVAQEKIGLAPGVLDIQTGVENHMVNRGK